MTSDALLVLQCLFDIIWRLFTSWHIPGTNTTPAAFFMFIGVCGLALKFLYRVSGVVPDVGIGLEESDSLLSDLPVNYPPRTHSGAPELGTRSWEFWDNPGTRSHR